MRFGLPFHNFLWQSSLIHMSNMFITISIFFCFDDFSRLKTLLPAYIFRRIGTPSSRLNRSVLLRQWLRLDFVANDVVSSWCANNCWLLRIKIKIQFNLWPTVLKGATSVNYTSAIDRLIAVRRNIVISITLRQV